MVILNAREFFTSRWWTRRLGLRGRLIVLIVLALLPAFGLLFWIREDSRRTVTYETHQRVIAHAQLVAESQASRDQAAYQLLMAISQHKELENPASAECSSYLKNVMGPGIEVYINLGAIAPDGTLVCGTGQLNLGVRDRLFFQDVVRNRRFVIGELIEGRLTGRTLLNYALPVTVGSDLRAVATASLNTDWVQRSLERIPVTPGSGLALLDRTGAVIAQHPRRDWLSGTLDAASLFKAANRGVMHLMETEPDGRRGHVATVWVGGRHDMLAVAGLIEDPAVTAASWQWLTAVLVLFAGGGFAIAVAFVFAERQIRQPVEHLVRGARQLSTGDLGVRTALSEGSIEMRELSAAFDQMAERLEDRERRAREAQRLEAIGRLAGGLAHDFNNMLTVILGFSESLHGEVRSPGGQESLRHIIAASERASRLTTQLLAIARKQPVQPAPMQLSDAVTQTEAMLRQVVREDITFETRLAADAGIVRADAAQLEQVVMNLALNARDAMPDGGTLGIETFNVTIDTDDYSVAAVGPLPPPGNYVGLSVSDTGCGMSSDVRERAFEPFFTTKGAAGTGLGLAMVYAIATQSGGFVACDSTPGRGTIVTLLFPRVDETVLRESCPPVNSPLAAGLESILVVEDEPSVRLLAERVLRNAGYAVVVASGADEAIGLVRQGLRPSLVLTDLVMPHMNGVLLAQSLRLLIPDLRVAYMSGHVEHPLLRPELDAEFIQKPFSAAGLLSSVRVFLDAQPV